MIHLVEEEEEDENEDYIVKPEIKEVDPIMENNNIDINNDNDNDNDDNDDN